MIRKTLVAATLSASLALTPVAAVPAFAEPGGRDYSALLLGLAAVGAIAVARKNERDRERREAEAAAEAARRAEVEARNRWREDHRWREERHRRVITLPGRCVTEVRTNRGWSGALGERCLDRAGIRTERLPRQCAFDARTERGWRTVYGERCLRNYGYVVEAGRR